VDDTGLDARREPPSAVESARSAVPGASRFATPADQARVARTVAALTANGMTVLQANDGTEARRIVFELIPDGAQIYQGSSQTLEVTGITRELETSGRYAAIRPRIRAMDRERDRDEIRRLAAAPDVMIGSVQAVTETGSLLAASYTGSQLAAYVFGAGRVIFVVGIQKIVVGIEEGLQRIENHAYPLEDARSLAAYGIHSGMNKVLIINREITPGRITVVVVDEILGF
jgi:hypothetical protein